MYRRNNLGDKIFMGVVWLILTSFAFICLYPFYIVIINSFSNPDAVLGDMALVLPREPTLINYVEVKYSLQGTTQGRYLTGGVPPVRFSM